MLVAAIACWALGCAGTTSNTAVRDFRASDVSLFDRGVDLVEDPVIIEGELGGEFERRVGRADLIAAVRVESLSSDLVKRHSSYRLMLRVGDRLKGASASEIVLRVHDDQPGFQSVRANEERLLQKPFVAFVKWESDPKLPEAIAHWHLSPDSVAVRDKIDFLLRGSAKETQTEVEVVQP